MTTTEQIQNCDDALSLLREYWIAAQTEEEKTRWMNKINHALDQRMVLMRERDAAQENLQTF